MNYLNIDESTSKDEMIKLLDTVYLALVYNFGGDEYRAKEEIEKALRKYNINKTNEVLYKWANEHRTNPQ